ncbi:group III truncated hemoglobin [Flavicella sediminum]|uniref:group III truncated hemoglobin n=1 Tax=Flavicella sediminum TaxID=2585141 RepID=UPI00111F8E6B|nr:group III truncated hemoglobin [Flavicella sediminum]
MRDIDSRKDLHKIVALFYTKLFADADMAVFFTEFKEPELLEKHLAVLVDFWDGILFDSGTYKKNAMAPHFEKNKSIPFEDQHFKKWIQLFSESVDFLFEGQSAETIKSRAQSIATVMQIKMIEFAKNT